MRENILSCQSGIERKDRSVYFVWHLTELASHEDLFCLGGGDQTTDNGEQRHAKLVIRYFDAAERFVKDLLK